MSDEITLTLNSPITDEQWDIINDVDFDYSDNITFHTKHGKEVEFVKRKTDWIPCSERLPEANDCPMDCLVTRKSKFIGNYTDMAVCERDGTWTHEDWKAVVLGDVESGKSTGLISTHDDDIIAWMPLPESYKEEENESN